MKRIFTIIFAITLALNLFLPTTRVYASYNDIYSIEQMSSNDPIKIPNYVYHYTAYFDDEPFMYVMIPVGGYSSIYHGWLALDWARSVTVNHSVYVGTLYRIDYNNGAIPAPSKKLPIDMLYGTDKIESDSFK